MASNTGKVMKQFIVFRHLANARNIVLFKLLALVLLPGSCQHSTKSSHRLEGDFSIVFDQQVYDSAVLLAVQALQQDIEHIFGEKPPIFSKLPEADTKTIVLIGSSIPGEMKQDGAHLEGEESHYGQVLVKGSKTYLIADGVGTRGLIYGVFTLSEDILGVPPMQLWANWQPPKEITIEDGATFHYPAPKVKWRVWFPNDRDLLVPWQTGSDDRYDVIMESLLRAKYNAIEGWHAIGRSNEFQPYETGKLYQKAREHGIRITGHHAMPFSGTLKEWQSLRLQYPDLQLPSQLSAYDTASLARFWKYSIETSIKNGLDPIWNIGFRGAGDVPFWKTFSDAPKSPVKRARIIQERLEQQVALLKKTTGQRDPDMRWTLYHENTHFVKDSLLLPPKDRNLAWVLVNDRRDHYPPSLVTNMKGLPPDQQYGYYYHFQFTSTGAHFAQAEGPAKLCDNLRYVSQNLGKAPSFVVFNVGNIREFITEITVGGKVLWHFELDPAKVLDEHFQQWFTTPNAHDVTDLYQDFIASYWQQKAPNIPGMSRQFIFQELRYRGAIESMLETIQKGEFNENPLYIRYEDTTYYNLDLDHLKAANQVEALIKATENCIKKLAQLEERAKIIRDRLATNRFFFDLHIKSQVTYMKYLNQSTRSLALAIKSTSLQERAALVDEGYKFFLRMRYVYGPLNDGIFSDWYYFAKEDGHSRFKSYADQGRILREPWVLKTDKTFRETIGGSLEDSD